MLPASALALQRGRATGIVLRSAIMLAVAVPVFSASRFRPALWEIVVVAVVGAIAGHLAAKVTAARARGVRVAVTMLGLVAAAGGALWFHPWRGPTDAMPRWGVIIIANGTPPSLTLGDVDALGPHVGAVAPLARRVGWIVAGESAWKAPLNGTTPAYFDMRGWAPRSGALFTQADLDASAKVVVLGSTTAGQLFGGEEPVGRSVRVDRVPFTVAAVLAPKGPEDDDVVIVPLSTFRANSAASAGSTFDGLILVSGATPDAVRTILRSRHGRATGDDDGFVVRDLR